MLDKMKKVKFGMIAAIVALLMWSCSHSNRYEVREKLSNNVTEDSLVIKKIEQHSSIIAENTRPLTIADVSTKIDYLAFIIAFIALFMAILSVIYAVRTYVNTKSLRSVTQKEKILKDIIRHLYRNKVAVINIMRDLKNNTDKFPSEEWLLFLKFSEDDLYLAKFADFFDNFDEMHHLQVIFRNYNIEVDVTLEHLKDKFLNIEIKEKDLNNLSNKTNVLANEIFKLLIKDTLNKTQERESEVKQYLIQQSERRNTFYVPPHFFENMFNADDNSILEKDISKLEINWLPFTK